MTKKNVIKKTTKQSKRKQLAVPRGVKEDPEVRRYWLALTDPFHPDAVGARVPDLYSAHTATYTVRASMTVTANSSGSATQFVFPNPVTSVFVQQGASPDFVPITWGDNTVANGARWGVDQNALGAKLDNYRIVGFGIRVTNMSSMTSSQGKFFLGSYPVNSTWHTKDFTVGGATLATNAGLTRAATTAPWGVPLDASGNFNSTLLAQYPGTVIRSALEMGEEAYDVASRPVDPRAFEFRTSNDQPDGWETVGASGASGDASYLDMNGFEAVFVSMQGAVPSVSAYDLEIVYHIEGRPYLGGLPAVTGQNQIVTPSMSSASPVNPMGFFDAVAAAVKIPAVRQVVDQGADLVHPLLGKFVRML